MEQGMFTGWSTFAVHQPRLSNTKGIGNCASLDSSVALTPDTKTADFQVVTSDAIPL